MLKIVPGWKRIYNEIMSLQAELCTLRYLFVVVFCRRRSINRVRNWTYDN